MRIKRAQKRELYYPNRVNGVEKVGRGLQSGKRTRQFVAATRTGRVHAERCSQCLLEGQRLNAASNLRSGEGANGQTGETLNAKKRTKRQRPTGTPGTSTSSGGRRRQRKDGETTGKRAQVDTQNEVAAAKTENRAPSDTPGGRAYEQNASWRARGQVSQGIQQR